MSIIKLKHSKLKQEITIKYINDSSDKNYIDQKDLCLKSLCALQLIIMNLKYEHKNDIKSIINILDTTYDDIFDVLKVEFKPEDNYEKYKH